MEVQKKICKTCGVLKERFLAGKFNQKDKKWVDEFGLSWNGHRCSLCHKEKAKENMRKLRHD